jgi:hypothetical protein
MLLEEFGKFVCAALGQCVNDQLVFSHRRRPSTLIGLTGQIAGA